MNTRRLLSTFAAVLLLCTLALTGCSTKKASDASSDADLLARIQERGEIVVAMEGTWAPWTYHDENDQLVGYDVEVAQKIAEKLGVKARFVEGEWDGLLAGLDDGRYDLMVNGVGVTAERQEKYDFSTPYAYNRTAVIVRGDYDEIHSMEDLKGKKTANTISSTYATQAESYGADGHRRGRSEPDHRAAAQRPHRRDAERRGHLLRLPRTRTRRPNIKIATLSDDAEQVAIPVRKGADTATLLKAVNDALSDLSASGELTALSEKYFGMDISKMD